jgi:hypothetical protein
LGIKLIPRVGEHEFMFARRTKSEAPQQFPEIAIVPQPDHGRHHQLPGEHQDSCADDDRTDDYRLKPVGSGCG